MRIGILGGTGPAGRALAARLAAVGFEVVVGSRSKYRAMEIVDSLLEHWPDHQLTIGAAENAGAADADSWSSPRPGTAPRRPRCR